MGVSAAPPAEPQGLQVRRLACDALQACLTRRLTVEDAVQDVTRPHTLDERDRALISSMLLTLFRHRGEIDAVLGRFLDKPLPRKSGPAREILTLAAAQLLFLEVPPHAAIDLAVRTAKMDQNARHFAGLINAVLRKLAATGPEQLRGLDAVRLNTPDWLWARWARNYGTETARRIATSHASRPGLDLSFREDPAPWVERLGGVSLPNGQIRLPAGHAPVPELPGFREGAWWIQDAAATLPVHLLGDVRGRRVLDLCAAPGGKAMQLAALGAEVTAVDVSETRLARLSRNLARTGLGARIRTEDILKSTLSGQWDAVLLDAPCSATGTIRRHPELPWLRQESQIAEMVSLQRSLLQRAADWVRPGGLLVYCSCSLEPEEGEWQARWFLESDPRFAVAPASGDVLPAGSVRPEGWVRTLPCMDYGAASGLDGFFAVALQRMA